MRIAVLGDFHLHENELEWSAQCMDDIRACSPDLVVPLGDFGSNRLIGSPEGLLQAHALLSRIGKPMHAILGNHDLQRESGKYGQPHGTMEQQLRQIFGQRSAYATIEENDFRMVFISTDPQPQEICFQVQECYVSEQQFNWLTLKLQERPGVPIIMFTHAPPIGCGLRTVPKVHVRSTNAYLDQNHHSMRWYDLLRTIPEVVIWFSAHYHLGHHYPDSSTTRWGTTFFTTGVHGSATRDGERLSRVIDVSSNGLRVMTLDHGKRMLRPAADWISGPPAQLVQQKRAILSALKLPPIQAAPSLECFATCPLGDGETPEHGLFHLEGDRWLIAAVDGYLWEVAVSTEAILGTLHMGSPVQAISSYEAHHIVYAAEDRLHWVVADDIWRFARENPDRRPQKTLELPGLVTEVVQGPNGVLWASGGRQLYEIVWQENEPDVSRAEVKAHTLAANIHRLSMDNGRLAVHTEFGTVYGFEQGTWTILAERALCWDRKGEESVALLADESGCKLVYELTTSPGKERKTMSVDDAFEPSDAQLICLGGGCVLLCLDGKVSIWNTLGNTRFPVQAKGRTTAIAVGKHTHEHKSAQFALSVVTGEPYARPQLQLWKYEYTCEEK